MSCCINLEYAGNYLEYPVIFLEYAGIYLEYPVIYLKYAGIYLEYPVIYLEYAAIYLEYAGSVWGSPGVQQVVLSCANKPFPCRIKVTLL